MIERLQNVLKEYVGVFIKEYKEYLSIDKMETLNNINYNKIFEIDNITFPVGKVSLGKIYLNKNNDKIIDNLSKMNGFNSKKDFLNNNNLSSYLKYMCENGYDIELFYKDVLMYFVFKLLIKEESSFINGIINQEIKYLKIKYSINGTNLYPKEEKIVEKITKIMKLEVMRKLLFMDKVTRFKYLCDNFGYRYGSFIEKIEDEMNRNFNIIKEKNNSYNNFFDYAGYYDSLSYEETFNQILEFEIRNKIR